MDRDQWVEAFALNMISTYAAVNYDENCYYGWREKEKSLSYEDAIFMANKEYDKMILFKTS